VPPSILVLSPASSADIMQRVDSAFSCHHLWKLDPPGQAALLRDIGGEIRAVLTTSGVGIGAQMIAQLPQLAMVAVHGIGLDKVDLDAVFARGIRLSNTPGVLTDDVADLAVLLVLATARRLPALDHYVRSGAWERKEALAPGSSIRGKVAGIVGFGRIGQAIAQRLQGFGMQVLYYQRSMVDAAGCRRSNSVRELAADSDYLIVAAPGGAATRHIINTEVLDALGPQGALINIARGSLVDEAALINALRDKRLGAAALDVFEAEPQVPPALRALDNVVLTPHVGSLTTETRYAMGKLALYNLLAFFAGAPLPSEVTAN
jgi:lactate dehydrogenase-like 2-hydroxyacid dehydrogenase